MQQLFQSAFLQSLGFAIANSLWQTAILWLVYTAISHLLPLSSANKYRFAVTAQLVSFVWFVVTIQFYYSQYIDVLRSTPLHSTNNIQAIIAGNQGATSQVLRYMVKLEQALPYVSMAYLMLMIVLCVRWISGYRQTQLVRKNGLQKIPVDWRLFVKRISAQLGIKKDISLYLSENISTPLTIGFWKPVILVPLASINHLTTHQLEAVLLHELAHIKRYDYLVNIILSAVEIGLFFNPFTQLLSKQIHKERENSCDDWVLQFQYQASDYAEALLRIAYLQSTPALAMAATGKKNDLLARVKRMIGQKENRFNYRRQLLALALVTMILSSVAWLNPVRNTQKDKSTNAISKQSDPRSIRKVAVEPMAAKISNPLFNPVFFLSDPLKAEVQKSLAAAQKEMDAVFQPADGRPALMETISPIVANAMEKAANEMAGHQNELALQIDGIGLARRTLEGLLADSLALLPRNVRSEVGDAFKTALQHMPADMSKLQKEFANAEKLKKQMNNDADKFKWDGEKVRKDIAHAMEELKQLSFDNAGFDFNLSEKQDKQKATEDKETLPKRQPWMRMKEASRPSKPDAPDQAPAMKEKWPAEFPIINVGNKTFELNIQPAMLVELISLAELSMRTDLEKASPEFQKMVQLKMVMIEKALSGKNKLIRTVNREENCEEKDSVIMKLQ
jgi:bla regulator protein BlaR1